MFKYFSGLLLWLIAIILKISLSIVLWPYGIVQSIRRFEFSLWYTQLAIGQDQYGNVLGQYLFNDVLITKNSQHKFGNTDETISSVLGKNKAANTLTKLGKGIAAILNFIDKDHVEKAANSPNN